VGEGARQKVLAALGTAPVSIDEVVRATGLPIAAVRTVLLELAMAGGLEIHGNQLVSLLARTE
jgi:DNA processing protein